MADQLLAFGLRASCHAATADNEKVGVRMLFRPFPSLGQVVRLHLQGFCLVESATEGFEADFHGWKGGRVEEWKGGRVEEWKGGRVD